MIPITPEEFLKKFCTEFEPRDHHHTGPGCVRQAEANGSVFCIEGKILASYANRHGGPVLEIGSDLGISSRYIMEGLDRFDARFLEMGLGPTNDPLYCVDIFHKWDDATGFPRRRRHDGNSDSFKGPTCRWAFVDGSHMYDDVLADIRSLDRLGIRRAFFHDTSTVHPKATSPTCGSDARYAVLDALAKTWTLHEIDTPCGLIYATLDE